MFPPRNRVAVAIAMAWLPLSAMVHLSPSEAWAGAAAAKSNRLPVTLFGQPCVLEGPLDPSTLKAIHSISPEEICSPFSADRTAEETRRAIDKLKAATGVPGSLDVYRDRLARRLKA